MSERLSAAYLVAARLNHDSFTLDSGAAEIVLLSGK